MSGKLDEEGREEGGEDDMEMPEEDDGVAISGSVSPADPSAEPDSLCLDFSKMEMSKKFQTVLTYLSNGERRWDDSSGDQNVRVLEEYMKTQMIEWDPREKTTPTLLHTLAKSYEAKAYDNISSSILKTVIGYLLENTKNDRSGQEQEHCDPVLKVAMVYNNLEFMELVKNWNPGKFSELLAEQDDQGRNCLHHIFFLNKMSSSFKLKDVRNSVIKRAPMCVPKATPEALAAKDKDGNTPIHYAAHYQLCWGRKNNDYFDIFQDMLAKADGIMKIGAGEYNNRNESPILYLQRTRDEYKKLLAKKLKICTEPSLPSSPMTEPARLPKNPKEHIENGIGEFELRRSNTATLSNTLSPDTKALNEKESANSVRKPPNSTVISAASEKDQGMAGEESADKILTFLTLHYIRERQDLKARELIYGKNGSDKNLYFDASSLEDASVDKVTELVRRMSLGGFHDVLSYVYLPTIAHGKEKDGSTMSKTSRKKYAMNIGLGRKPREVENPKIGRSCLIAAFDKLHEAGVRKILRLVVEDMKAPSHTDEAIERCLRGCDSLGESRGTPRYISAETWDWRKLDISTDVIEFAAPDVEQLHLYWSGSQVVLRGWACQDGIPRLYATNKKLKRVIIEASPGLETRERMNKTLSRFKNDVERGTAGRVDIVINRHMSGLFSKVNDANQELTNGTMEGEKQHVWVTRMEEFRAALQSIHDELQAIPGHTMPRKVKVALIDDGVELNSLETYNGIVEATGVSFCPPGSNAERPWSQSSRGHGTVMANMILRVNPWARLHVMRLHDGQDNDGSRTIFADSAAQAILGAVQRNVDVMSMSWTVRQKIQAVVGSSTASSTVAGTLGEKNTAGSSPQKSADDQAVELLRQAINEAKNAGILMFCSASDSIEASAWEQLPYQQAPDHIIRIGAALALGQRDPHTEDARHIDFFFPGNRVREVWNPRSSTAAQYYDGSSVATALAAGLGSLILYCTLMMQSYHLSRDESEHRRFDRYVTALKKCQGMKRAFSNIQVDSWEHIKYLPVWGPFGNAADDIRKAKGVDKLCRLDDLVTDLAAG